MLERIFVWAISIFIWYLDIMDFYVRSLLHAMVKYNFPMQAQRFRKYSISVSMITANSTFINQNFQIVCVYQSKSHLQPESIFHHIFYFFIIHNVTHALMLSMRLCTPFSLFFSNWYQNHIPMIEWNHLFCLCLRSTLSTKAILFFVSIHSIHRLIWNTLVVAFANSIKLPFWWISTFNAGNLIEPLRTGSDAAYTQNCAKRLPTNL